jgi:hypothetical protein
MALPLPTYEKDEDETSISGAPEEDETLEEDSSELELLMLGLLPPTDELEFPPPEDGLLFPPPDDEDMPATESLLLSPSSLSDEQDRVNVMASTRAAVSSGRMLFALTLVSCVLIMYLRG